MKQQTGSAADSSTDQVAQTISLLTTTTGLIDIYALAVDGEPDWIVPQSLVLEIVPLPNAKAKHIEWQDQQIPTHSLLPNTVKGAAVAVLIEGDTDASRIALIVETTPVSMRVRISNLRDTNNSQVLPHVYQKVLLENKLYQVPDIDRLTKAIMRKKNP
ncbi:MAG: hypothetical protein VXW65_00305 [Pseudomonadota bacterium]|nr:hypothetical protein [Pseudomonadota bacterium]